MTDMENGRATTQTLDRRVERLEVASAEMGRTVDRLQMGQEHMRELMSARFTSVEAGQVTTNAKLDQLTAYLASLVAEAQKSQVNWRDTPPAKEILAELKEQHDYRETLEARVQKSERMLYAVTVVCALFVIVVNLVGPTVIKVVLG